MAFIITADYHTHTKYSDGKGSIEDNVVAALSTGLKTIAISDHGINHIGIGMKKRDIQKMRNEIDRLNSKYPSIKVLFGVEANPISMNGEIDVPESMLHIFDFISVGYHRAVLPHTLSDAWNLFLRNRINALSKSEVHSLRTSNTLAIINCINRYPVKIITHPGAKAQIDIRLLARSSAKLGVALEINPNHDVFYTRNDYTNNNNASNHHISKINIDYVRIALEEGASFVINSDAHTPQAVGRFDTAIKIAKLAGVPVERILNAESVL